MKGTRKSLLALLAVLLLMPTAAPAQDDQAKMEAWAKAMTPGRPHAELAEQAGEWRYVVTFWEKPGAEPTQLEGVSVKTMIMDGRFLHEELRGEFMGRPFQGVGITGYDNVTGNFVAIWFDNMSTNIHFYTGEQDASGARTYRSTAHDPATGRAIPIRSVGRTIDRDHHVFESYNTEPDGSEYLHMRVEYERAATH